MSNPEICLTLSVEDWRKHDAPPVHTVRCGRTGQEDIDLRKQILTDAFGKNNVGDENNQPESTWFALDGDRAVAVSSIDDGRKLGWTGCAPTHRGKGYGRAAVAAAIRGAFAEGDTSPVGMVTGLINKEALGLYLSLGFLPANSPSEQHLRDAGWLDRKEHDQPWRTGA